jgi:hypothetical protein
VGWRLESRGASVVGYLSTRWFFAEPLHIMVKQKKPNRHRAVEDIIDISDLLKQGLLFCHNGGSEASMRSPSRLHLALASSRW